MDEEPREDQGAPPGAIHEELKQKEAGRFSANPNTQMGYDSASDADEPDDRAAGELGRRRKKSGGVGDETGVER
jgi:hypothetical protein